MLNRRNFIRMSLGAAGTLCVPLVPRLARAARAEDEPHFFLQVIFEGGLDPAYLFDARPLAMTQAGLIQNYLGTDPAEWQAGNGTKTWTTRLTDPLKPYRDSFSVLNGVIMATGFDGHDQNMNYLLAGDPFGGESFVPHLNRNRVRGGAPRPLDAVSAGLLLASVTNGGSTVPLTADAAGKLLGRLKKASPLGASNPLYAFIQRRMLLNGAGDGAFSLGARAMAHAYEQTPDFAERFKSLALDPSAPEASPTPMGPSERIDPRYLHLCLELFRQGIAPSAMFIAGPGSFDAHSPDTAAKLPALIGSAIEGLAFIFKTLKETPFDATRSFLDVTTVMVASEFGRTMRQKGLPIDKTGTDHNPLNNSILIGGKGIRGGLVIGESDTRAAGEKVSKAHAAFDPSGLKMMGKPFDFTAGRVRTDLPETYDPADYLGMASVANTLYSLFGVAPALYRKLGRNGPTAATVPGLLA